MSSKLFPTLATAVIALAGAIAMNNAMAVEATQFDPAPSVKTRAEVKAELAASRSASVRQYGEATNFIDRPSTLTRTAAVGGDTDRSVQVVRLGDATQFVDQPGTLTRADVRAEALASLREERANNRH